MQRGRGKGEHVKPATVKVGDQACEDFLPSSFFTSFLCLFPPLFEFY